MTDSKLKVSGKRCMDEVKITDPALMSDQKRKEEKERERKTGSEEEKGEERRGGTKMPLSLTGSSSWCVTLGPHCLALSSCHGRQFCSSKRSTHVQSHWQISRKCRSQPSAVRITPKSGFHSLSRAAGVRNSNMLVGTVIFLIFRHKMELRNLGTIAFWTS